MKILYITNGIAGSGGLERVLAVKASYLTDKMEYEVHILTLNDGDISPFYDFSNKIKFHDIRVNGYVINYFLRYKRGIKKVLNSIKPAIISVCDDGLKGLLFPILFGKRIPVIYERHASMNLNFISEKNNSAIQKLKNYCVQILMLLGAEKFNSFVILTNGNKNDWPNVNCTVIPNPSPFSNIDKNPKNIKKDIVLAVGTQSYNKGYDRLITIWEMVVKKFPDWRLEIYGKINENLNLQQKVEKLGLSESFILNEPIKNITDKYNEASIFALSSRSEGFGMVLIEAMSYGVPCVAFDCPHGPADIIKNGEDGFLIENGNEEAFATKLMLLMKDITLRKQLGNKALYNVTHFNVDEVVKKWDVLFKSLVKK